MPGADGVYNQSEDPGSEGATLASTDDSYASRTGQSQIPVQKDDAPVEDPIDAATADSDETLRMSLQFVVLRQRLTIGRARRGRSH